MMRNMYVSKVNMHSHLFVSSQHFLMMIFLILIHIPTSLCVKSEHYINCSKSFQCANFQNIGYPFWGQNQPDYCGHPGFMLDCNGDTPEITIMSQIYRVLDIDNVSHTLNVTRKDFWNNVCPTYLYNTTLNFTLFDYIPDDKNVTLYYDCPDIYPSGSEIPIPGLSRNLECTMNNTFHNSYYATRDITNFSSEHSQQLAKCHDRVTVQVLQSNMALANESNLTSESVIPTLNGGFSLKWAANDTLCDKCRGNGGQCGYDWSLNEFTCFCPDRRSDSLMDQGSFSKSNHRLKISIGIVIAVLAILLVISTITIHSLQRAHSKKSGNAMDSKKKEAKNNLKVEELLRPKRFSYSDVKKMTNSFKDKVGQGGFGAVYRGKLSDGCLVAVKVLCEFKGNDEDFINEVVSISRTSHVNIVTLLGFCHEENKRALIYEFMPNGSLDKFINDQGSSHTNRRLEWKLLYGIAISIARGLEYLHRDCNTRILHFDIKPHNILLDENFCPKISDFGLAKLCKREKSTVSTIVARGTFGYIAPEVCCRSFGRVSYKSDVYSYGMMVLEMVGVRNYINVGASCTSEIYFPDWIYKQLEPGKCLRLRGVKTEEEKEVTRKMIIVSLWCIQNNPSYRPSMTKVVEMLESSLHSLQIPPTTS